jgi:hypothetical protein
MMKHPQISIEDVITQKIGLDATDMDGEIVMMDLEKGKYYSFNEVGSRIWNIIEKPLVVKRIISILLDEFEVDEKACEESVLCFLDRIYNDELISVS